MFNRAMSELRYTVGATVRNEGPFILEWLAWQKMLGFDDVVFAHNDNTDHMVEMLDRLSDAGWCHAVEHFPDAKNRAPVRSGLQTIHETDVVKDTDWLFICDVDEYLVPKRGDGRVQDLLAGFHDSFRGVSVQWRAFGTSDITHWRDDFLHRMFLFAAWPKHRANAFYKSFSFRPAQNFKMVTAHEPRGWIGDGAWGAGPNRWAHVSGAPMDYDPDGPDRKRTPPDEISLAGAQLNHYIVKTAENFAYKKGTPCPARKHFVDRYTDRFFETHNRNDVLDPIALDLSDRFDAIYAELVAVPGVAQLHHLSCADLLVAMHAKFGTDVASDPRYAAHLGAAEDAA